jgi:triacylglycerol esterase/lipase EstA (alpha/beta hydrolase family)
VYADINGLKMFYEIRGTSDPAKVPVVLLHGAISATGTSFGPLPDLLAQNPSGHRRGAARSWPDRRHRPAHVGPGDGR